MKVLFSLIFLFSMSLASEIVQIQAPFPGVIYKPNDNRTYPAVIMLHGSDGGNGDYWFKTDETGLKASIPQYARELAAMGYVVYGLCYFDCRKQPGYKNYPPDELINVDLGDVTHKAIVWLKKSAFVKDKSVSIMGFSRGAEQVLFLESLLINLKRTQPNLILPNKIISASPYQTTVSGIPLWWALQAKQTGVPPAVTFNLPAWKFMGRSFIGGIPIDIRNTSIPNLIFSFKKDPQWGDADMNHYKKQFPAGHQFYVGMKPGESADAKFKLLPAQLPKVTFVEFLNEGHSRPSDTQQVRFFLGTLHKFLQQKP